MKKYKVTFRDGSSVIVNAKDSVASDLYAEIKKAYPNAQITKRVSINVGKYGKPEKFVGFKITNGDTLGPNVKQFLQYLAKKYAKNDAMAVGYEIVAYDMVM